MFRRAALCLACVSLASLLAADKPALDAIFPAGGPRGSTQEVTLSGKFDPWPPQAWSSNPGLAFQFSTNKGSAQLTLASNAPPGPCLVRVFNEAGPSDLRIFVVSERAETLETEPNNHFAKAQAVTNLPTVVNGRLEKNGDVDSFAIRMKGGEWLDASLDCYTLLAKLDPALRLVTTNGYQLAWNHDFGSLDPRMIWQAPADITVVLQVFGFAYPADSDIRLSGAPADVYRLHLKVADTPPLDVAAPLTEREPNDQTNNAPALSLPLEIAGSIAPAGDIDRFKLILQKGETVEIRVQASALGSPLDAWAAIEDSKGKELTRNDDADNSRDPRIEFQAPESGDYFIVIGSLTHQGGPSYRYRLSAHTLAPDYGLTSAAESFAIEPGATNTLKLAFQRLRGFTNELTLKAENLPESVSALTVKLPEKSGEVSLTLIAQTNAAPFNGPFQISARDNPSQTERHVRFEMVSRTENNGVPGGYSKLLVESTDQLWLTVKPAKPSEAKK